MKKIFLLLVLLFQLTSVFGQKFDEQEVTTSWYPASKCFPEIYYQVITRYPNHPRNYKHDGTYSRWIKFKNVSGKPIKFWAKMNIQNSSRGEFELDYQLAPGTTDQNPFGETHTTKPGDQVHINIYKATYDVTTTNYIDCNNGILSDNTNQTNNSNQQTNSTNNTSNNSTVQINKTQPNQTPKIQTQSNQVINAIPNNTNTEILNVLESTTNQVTNSITSSIQKSAVMSKENSKEVNAKQEEFAENNLTDKEIDSLLANPDPNNYATINVYNSIKQNVKWYVMINGKKLPVMDKKNNYSVYRIYSGNKLVVQTYPIGSMGSTLPIQSITTRIRKGKNYHFLIKKEGMMNFSLEQIDEEPLDKKGNKIYENINQKIKSDIDY